GVGPANRRPARCSHSSSPAPNRVGTTDSEGVGRSPRCQAVRVLRCQDTDGEVTADVLDAVLFPPVRLDMTRLRARVAGRRVLLTGGSRGIGAAIAAQLGAAGAHLVLVARDEER